MRLCALTVFLALTMQSCSAAERCHVVVFLLPLEVELYEPPTIEYLEKYGRRVTGELPKTCALAKAAQASTQKRPLEGHDKRLRIVITEGEERVFVTAEKHVLFRNEIAVIDPGIVDSAVRELVNMSRKPSDK